MHGTYPVRNLSELCRFWSIILLAYYIPDVAASKIPYEVWQHKLTENVEGRFVEGLDKTILSFASEQEYW